jgi:hypothetical protein
VRKIRSPPFIAIPPSFDIIRLAFTFTYSAYSEFYLFKILCYVHLILTDFDFITRMVATSRPLHLPGCAHSRVVDRRSLVFTSFAFHTSLHPSRMATGQPQPQPTDLSNPNLNTNANTKVRHALPIPRGPLWLEIQNPSASPSTVLCCVALVLLSHITQARMISLESTKGAPQTNVRLSTAGNLP